MVVHLLTLRRRPPRRWTNTDYAKFDCFATTQNAYCTIGGSHTVHFGKVITQVPADSKHFWKVLACCAVSVMLRAGTQLEQPRSALNNVVFRTGSKRATFIHDTYG